VAAAQWLVRRPSGGRTHDHHDDASVTLHKPILSQPILQANHMRRPGILTAHVRLMHDRAVLALKRSL
jgi:hypothetical protein